MRRYCKVPKYYDEDCRYLQLEKWQCKYKKGWYNVIQKIKTLPVNKKKNATAVFSISTEHLTKLEKEA